MRFADISNYEKAAYAYYHNAYAYKIGGPIWERD